MSSPHQQGPLTGGYDQSLLAAAPAATRAAKQEGYNVDLLDDGRHRSTPPTRTQDLENARPKEHQYSPVERGAASTPRKLPFWKTRRGIIILSILAVIIVGAVVGGAVGGSVGKKGGGSLLGSSNSTQQGSTGDSISSSPPAQGMQPQSTTAGSPADAAKSISSLILPTGPLNMTR